MASGVTSPALLFSPYVLPRYCLLLVQYRKKKRRRMMEGGEKLERRNMGERMKGAAGDT